MPGNIFGHTDAQAHRREGEQLRRARVLRHRAQRERKIRFAKRQGEARLRDGEWRCADHLVGFAIRALADAGSESAPIKLLVGRRPTDIDFRTHFNADGGEVDSAAWRALFRQVRARRRVDEQAATVSHTGGISTVCVMTVRYRSTWACRASIQRVCRSTPVACGQ